jgi:hypothetical protein
VTTLFARMTFFDNNFVVDNNHHLFAADLAAQQDRQQRRKRRRTTELLDALCEENFELRNERATLEAENAILAEENAALRQQNADQAAQDALKLEEMENEFNSAVDLCRVLERRRDTVSRNYRELQRQYDRIFLAWRTADEKLSALQADLDLQKTDLQKANTSSTEREKTNTSLTERKTTKAKRTKENAEKLSTPPLTSTTTRFSLVSPSGGCEYIFP